MRNVFRLLSIVLNAILDIAEEKPDKRYMNVIEARGKYEAGLISVQEYHEAFESKGEL